MNKFLYISGNPFFSESCFEGLTGKTVITADYGNLVRGNRLFGHGFKSRSKGLRKVPWHVIGENSNE